jgi:hypothetical protein
LGTVALGGVAKNEGRAMLKYLGTMASVAIVHAGCSIMLYYWRVKMLFAVAESDVVVFALPGTIAFVVYFLVTWRGPLSAYQPFPLKVCLAALIAFFAWLASFTCFGIIAANTWGT